MRITRRVKEVPAPSVARWATVVRVPGHIARHVLTENQLRPELRIYRYMRATHLLDYLDSGLFRFSSVLGWVDPWERWWHEALFAQSSPLYGANAYATCWTTNSRDEPFWRLYESQCDHRDCDGDPLPKDLPAVRIRTTVGRLATALGDALNQYNAKVFLAPVAYTSDAALRRYQESLHAGRTDIAREAAHALSYKRTCFGFEREVRVMWIDRLTASTHRNIALPPSSFIDDIMIAPVVDAESRRAEDLKDAIRAKGLKKVRRSLLYQWPGNNNAEK